MHVLLDARDAGHEVMPSLIDNAATFLERAVNGELKSPEAMPIDWRAQCHTPTISWPEPQKASPMLPGSCSRARQNMKTGIC